MGFRDCSGKQKLVGLPGVLSRPLSVDPSPFQTASSRASSMSNIRLHLKIKKNRPICPQSVPFCVIVFPRMCLYWVSLTALSQCLAPAVLVNPCPQPKSCATFSFMKDGETKPCGSETPCPRPEAKSPHPGSKRLLSVASSDPPRAGMDMPHLMSHEREGRPWSGTTLQDTGSWEHQRIGWGLRVFGGRPTPSARSGLYVLTGVDLRVPLVNCPHANLHSWADLGFSGDCCHSVSAPGDPDPWKGQAYFLNFSVKPFSKTTIPVPGLALRVRDSGIIFSLASEGNFSKNAELHQEFVLEC